MESQPLVTIATPSLNSGAYIRRAIESVLSQNYDRFEYMIMDGGSKDCTRAIVSEYSSRLTYHQAPDVGAANAINTAFQHSKGSVFAWLNADDSYLPGTISSGLKLMGQRREIHVFYGKAYWIDHNDQQIGSYPTQPFTVNALSQECIISQPASFIRSSAFLEIGMLDPKEEFAFDYDLWIRMARRFRLEHVNEYWANSRMHSASITLSRRRQVFEANMRLLKRHYGYVPLQWVYSYCCYLLDGRDQFFQPLRRSITAYGLSLLYGLARNQGYRRQFLKEWTRKGPLRLG